VRLTRKVDMTALASWQVDISLGVGLTLTNGSEQSPPHDAQVRDTPVLDPRSQARVSGGESGERSTVVAYIPAQGPTPIPWSAIKLAEGSIIGSGEGSICHGQRKGSGGDNYGRGDEAREGKRVVAREERGGARAVD
jgi:hypothetical protein